MPHRWTEKIDGQAVTLDVAENDLIVDYRTPSFDNDIGEMEWLSMWWVDAAPAVGEGMGAILSFAGKDFDWTIELPFPTGGHPPKCNRCKISHPYAAMVRQCPA